jgi:ribosomal protein S18 acetylase RimI-like enzyme
MTTTVRLATRDDAALLHELAAATFALACPPGTTQAAVEDFIAAVLSETSFAGYLADPSRALLVAEVDGVPAGYTMLVFDDPSDSDVAAAITARPTAELSKVYVLESQHGAGVAGALMTHSLAEARAREVAGVWLGVNQHNQRANRFYEKNGFVIVGTKKFLVGGKREDDFVRELVLVLPEA